MRKTPVMMTYDLSKLPVLFLDVDGVLNRCAESGFGLDDDKLSLLGRIVDLTQCRLVLSSTWRQSNDQLTRLKIALEDKGMILHDVTPTLDSPIPGSVIILGKPRGLEIQAWIDDHGAPDRFVIVDDMSDMEHLLPHLVRTRSTVGLTPTIADEIIAALSQTNESQTS
jgi:hypothetical protein